MHDNKSPGLRDDIGQRERKGMRGRDRAERDSPSFSLPLFHAHVRTHARPIVRTSDRSRASFEKQCKRERHAGLSFLPTFFLAHDVPGSCSLPVPSLPVAFPVGPPRGLSFALFPSPPKCTLSFTILRSLSHRLSLSLLISDAWILYPCRFFSRLLHRRDATILVQCSFR